MNHPALDTPPVRAPEGVARRRILLVSYHYPPSEATGAMRWQQLTRFAAEYGWQVDVVTLDPAELTRKDLKRLEILPATTRTFGVRQPKIFAEKLEHALWLAWKAVRPARKAAVPSTAPTPPKTTATDPAAPEPVYRWLGGPRTMVKGWTAWMHNAQERAWSREAYRVGLQVGRDTPPDIVISCGPPHMAAHLAGRRLAAELKVPYVMDLRDPWSLMPRLPAEWAHPIWYAETRRAERRCVAAASLLVMNTPGATAAMQQLWPGARIMTAMNGWDDEPLPSAVWPAQFRVVYAGVIYMDRTPRPFFRAVSMVQQELGLTPENFEIRLIGDVQSHDGTDVRQMAREEGIERLVRVIPPMPRREVLKEYAEAALLLSLPQDSEMALPSKVFEYMRFPAFVLAQSSPASATGSLVLEAGGHSLMPKELDATAQVLRHAFGEFRAGRRPEPLAREGRYSRANEAAKLFAALDALVPGSKES